MYPFTFKSFFFSTASCSGISNGPLINYTTGFLIGCFLMRTTGRTVELSHHRTKISQWLQEYEGCLSAKKSEQATKASTFTKLKKITMIHFTSYIMPL